MGNSNKQPDIEKLLSQMGSRTEPSPKQSAKNKIAVKQHWQKIVRQKQRQRRYIWAVAASLVLVATLAIYNFTSMETNPSAALVAQVLSSQEGVQIKSSNDEWSQLQNDAKININSTIKTNNSTVSLQWNDGSEIRLAANTEVLLQHELINLHHGSIYHDTDKTNVADPLVIVTQYGQAEHIGTRYLVSETAQNMTVAVRSGQVRIAPKTGPTIQQNSVLKPNQMVLITSAGPSAITDIKPHAGIWEWTFQAQADFDLNNKSLFQFVQWFTYQTGLKVDWQDVENASKRVRLQGSIKHMSSQQALDTVFYSTQYTYQINNGVLQISKQ